MNQQLAILGASDDNLENRIADACDWMETHYQRGFYIEVTVSRHWSRHNPVLSGEVARPAAYRWYLERELSSLAHEGAEIRMRVSRERVSLTSPDLLRQLDETELDITRKKLFLFGPERVELSAHRLEHYTGTRPEDFQRAILLTNYHMHTEAFLTRYPDAIQPVRPTVQMPAFHHKVPNEAGYSIVNIGVGPSNAKTLTDHVAVLRPDALLMVGHCAGIRNHQEIGDYVLASAYVRADHLMDDLLPLSVPVVPSLMLNRYLAKSLDDAQLPYRWGAVYTTADRNWELALSKTIKDLRISRSIAVDMESATVAANGFRYRIPHATLLCVSDKPLHGKPKLPQQAKEFYQDTRKRHLETAIRALSMARDDYPFGIPNADVRGLDQPLI
jgi:AMP nucleosidase